MKSFKLIVHHPTFSRKSSDSDSHVITTALQYSGNIMLLNLYVTAADLIINLKDYPGLNEKDIVEIYHPENDYPRLLLQVAKVDVPARGRGKNMNQK